MNKIRIIFIGLCATTLVACSSNPEKAEEHIGDNKRADAKLFDRRAEISRSALELPPDLISSANEKVRNNVATNAARAVQVLPQAAGVSVHSKNGRDYLRVNADAKFVWDRLSEFWSLQEIDLSGLQPEAGIMETDWFSRITKSADGGVIGTASDVLKSFIAQRTAADKFTLRLERADDNTNIFITHRRREKIAKEYNNLQKANEYNWVESNEDPEKIAQLLQSLMAFLGNKPS